MRIGILKRKRKRNTSFLYKNDKNKRDKQSQNNNNGIKWDILSINEQNDYRKNRPTNKEKLNGSQSKYVNFISNDDDDVYINGLNKVNQINPNDEAIRKILNVLKGNINNKKCIKRNNSRLKHSSLYK